MFLSFEIDFLIIFLNIVKALVFSDLTTSSEVHDKQKVKKNRKKSIFYHLKTLFQLSRIFLSWNFTDPIIKVIFFAQV